MMKEVLNIKSMIKWIMTHWSSILSGIWIFLITYVFFIKHNGFGDFWNNNSNFDSYLFLIILILTIGLLSVLYINIRDERRKVIIRNIREGMLFGIIMVTIIFIFIYLSVSLTKWFSKLLLNYLNLKLFEEIEVLLALGLFILSLVIIDKGNIIKKLLKKSPYNIKPH